MPCTYSAMLYIVIELIILVRPGQKWVFTHTYIFFKILSIPAAGLKPPKVFSTNLKTFGTDENNVNTNNSNCILVLSNLSKDGIKMGNILELNLTKFRKQLIEQLDFLWLQRVCLILKRTHTANSLANPVLFPKIGTLCPIRRHHSVALHCVRLPTN